MTLRDQCPECLSRGRCSCAVDTMIGCGVVAALASAVVYFVYLMLRAAAS